MMPKNKNARFFSKKNGSMENAPFGAKGLSWKFERVGERSIVES